MSTLPRYRQLAETLRAAIGRGDYPPGALLPTEHELCAAHGVSRHTAREALRALQDDGLIARRRGAGTVVLALPRAPALVQPLDGVKALLQYARDARFTVERRRALGPRDRVRAALRLSPDVAYTVLVGLRAVADAPPIARARIAIRADLAPTAGEAEAIDGAITEWITGRHGLVFANVEQEISADLLNDVDAAALQAAPGAPALRTRRWFRLASGDIAVASDTLHPADRFVYAMTVHRAEPPAEPPA